MNAHGLEHSINFGLGMTFLVAAPIAADAQGSATAAFYQQRVQPPRGWINITASSLPQHESYYTYVETPPQTMTDFQRFSVRNSPGDSATIQAMTFDGDRLLIERYKSRISAADLAIVRNLMGSMSSLHGDPDLAAAIQESYN